MWEALWSQAFRELIPILKTILHFEEHRTIDKFDALFFLLVSL